MYLLVEDGVLVYFSPINRQDAKLSYGHLPNDLRHLPCPLSANQKGALEMGPYTESSTLPATGNHDSNNRHFWITPSGMVNKVPALF